MKKIAVVASIALLTSLSALAQDITRAEQRQTNQQQRIDQGIKSGQLTTQEAARLEKGQERMQGMENKAKADGVVTKKESARLKKAENKQSRHIAQQKHDRQRDMNHDGKNDRRSRQK